MHLHARMNARQRKRQDGRHLRGRRRRRRRPQQQEGGVSFAKGIELQEASAGRPTCDRGAVPTSHPAPLGRTAPSGSRCPDAPPLPPQQQPTRRQRRRRALPLRRFGREAQRRLHGVGRVHVSPRRAATHHDKAVQQVPWVAHVGGWVQQHALGHQLESHLEAEQRLRGWQAGFTGRVYG